MKPASDPGQSELERLLTGMRAELAAFVRERAGTTLLRLETAEDLAQGVCTHALERGLPRELENADAHDGARRAWLLRVAENFVNDRRDYWSALKRDGSRVLRLEFAEMQQSEVRALSDLAASVTGPSTFAVRREQVALAAIALDMLLPRDKALIDGLSRGATISEQATALGLSYDAVERARSRAIERFQRTFRLALQSRA